MSNYTDEEKRAWQRAEDAQAAAKQELEYLRIRQAFPNLQLNQADRQIIADYMNPQPVTLEAFVTAWYLEGGTLQKMLCPPKPAAEANKDLRNLPYEELRERVRQEQLAKEANRNNPPVQQVEFGAPILPAHWDKRLIKRLSSDEIKSERIKFDRKFGWGSFNRALTARLQGADTNELRRSYGFEQGE